MTTAAVEKAVKPSRKEKTGEVISDKMQKTIVVKVVRRVPHPRFKKIVKVSNKFYAHDEEGKAKIGDTVLIAETRPLSKLKRWELVQVIVK
jgi:small subunit ribosomal protein S17